MDINEGRLDPQSVSSIHTSINAPTMPLPLWILTQLSASSNNPKASTSIIVLDPHTNCILVWPIAAVLKQRQLSKRNLVTK